MDADTMSVNKRNVLSINSVLTQEDKFINAMQTAIQKHDYLTIYQLLDPKSYNSVVGMQHAVQVKPQKQLVDNIRPELAHYLSSNLIAYLGKAFPFLYYDEYKLGHFHVFFGNWWDHQLFGDLDVIHVSFKFSLAAFEDLKQYFDKATDGKKKQPRPQGKLKSGVADSLNRMKQQPGSVGKKANQISSTYTAKKSALSQKRLELTQSLRKNESKHSIFGARQRKAKKKQLIVALSKIDNKASALDRREKNAIQGIMINNGQSQPQANSNASAVMNNSQQPNMQNPQAQQPQQNAYQPQPQQQQPQQPQMNQSVNNQNMNNQNMAQPNQPVQQPQPKQQPTQPQPKMPNMNAAQPQPKQQPAQNQQPLQTPQRPASSYQPAPKTAPQNAASNSVAQQPQPKAQPKANSTRPSAQPSAAQSSANNSAKSSASVSGSKFMYSTQPSGNQPKPMPNMSTQKKYSIPTESSSFHQPAIGKATGVTPASSNSASTGTANESPEQTKQEQQNNLNNAVQSITLRLEAQNIDKYFGSLPNFINRTRLVYQNYILHLFRAKQNEIQLEQRHPTIKPSQLAKQSKPTAKKPTAKPVSKPANSAAPKMPDMSKASGSTKKNTSTRRKARKSTTKKNSTGRKKTSTKKSERSSDK